MQENYSVETNNQTEMQAIEKTYGALDSSTGASLDDAGQSLSGDDNRNQTVENQEAAPEEPITGQPQIDLALGKRIAAVREQMQDRFSQSQEMNALREIMAHYGADDIQGLMQTIENERLNKLEDLAENDPKQYARQMYDLARGNQHSPNIELSVAGTMQNVNNAFADADIIGLPRKAVLNRAQNDIAFRQAIERGAPIAIAWGEQNYSPAHSSYQEQKRPAPMASQPLKTAQPTKTTKSFKDMSDREFFELDAIISKRLERGEAIDF